MGRVGPAPSRLWRGAYKLSIGSAAYGAAQWLALIVLARMGGAQEVGRFAYALAVTAPVFMMAGFGLRTFLSSDARGEFAFRAYVLQRLAVLALATVLCAAVATLIQAGGLLGLVLLLAAAKSIEGVADICHGKLHQTGHAARVGESLTARALATVLALIALPALGSSAESLAFVLLGAWTAVLLTKDIPGVLALYDQSLRAIGRGIKQTLSRSVRDARKLTALTWPLAVAALLASLQLNAIRYVVESQLGMEALGVFAVMAYVGVVGGRFVHSVSQAFTPGLGESRIAWDDLAFAKLLGQLVGFAVACGMALIAVVAFAGDQLLVLLFRRSAYASTSAFIWVAVACTLEFVAVALHYALTSRRGLRGQLLTVLSGTVVLVIAAPVLTRSYGLSGAGMAWALAWLAVVAASAVALLHALAVDRRIHRSTVSPVLHPIASGDRA